MAKSTALILSDDARPDRAKVQICSDTSKGLKKLIRRKDNKPTPTLNRKKGKKNRKRNPEPLAREPQSAIRSEIGIAIAMALAKRTKMMRAHPGTLVYFL
jgi:hypothetical protein